MSDIEKRLSAIERALMTRGILRCRRDGEPLKKIAGASVPLPANPLASTDTRELLKLMAELGKRVDSLAKTRRPKKSPRRRKG